MRLGLHLGFDRNYGEGASFVPPPILSVNANGYGAVYDGTPVDYQPGDAVSLIRKGYDGSYTSPSGVPTPTLLTNISETATVRHRARNAYPDDGSEPVWGDNVALSTYVYSTDSILGATNNSTKTSPKPTCGWAVLDRTVVGNSINLQLVAFHRNARNRQQVACVVFSATDGTNTVYSLVATSSVLTSPGGTHPFSDVRIEGFETNIDITTLNNDSDITVNASVYPWIGDASSVATSNSANQYEFAPLVYRKNTSKASSPPLVYIASTGTDATVDVNGASGGNTKVSTNAVTAKANAFLTFKSAVEALKAATNVTGGFTDGCEVRLVDATAMGATSITAGTYQQSAAMTITRDPLSANRAAAPFTIGTSISTRQSWIRFSDMEVIRGASVQPGLTGTPQKAMFENVDFNNGGFSSVPFASTVNIYYINVTVTNCASSMWNVGATPTNLIRGCTISSGSWSRPETGVLIGCKFTAMGGNHPGAGTRQANRSIVAFNKFLGLQATTGLSIFSGTMTNAVCVQNLFEQIGTSTVGSIVGPSNDAATYSLPGLIMSNNTVMGAMLSGRINGLYDETIGTYRDQSLACLKANLLSGWTTKTDYFIGLNGGAAAAESVLHTGAHNIIYAVDINEIHAEWPDANVVSYGYDSLARRWAHYGPYLYGDNSSVQTGVTTFIESLNDAKIKVRACVTYTPGGSKLGGTYSAGSGSGGDYRPQRISEGDANDSPLLGKVANPALRYDLAGTARAASNDAIGCYA